MTPTTQQRLNSFLKRFRFQYSSYCDCFSKSINITGQVKVIILHCGMYVCMYHASLQEWDSHLKDLLLDLSDKTEDKNDDMTKIAIEKITALYGANAFKKTLEELKKDAKSAKIDELLLIKKKAISNANVSFRKQN